MKYLLDTHVLFWSMCDENKLSEQVLSLINDPGNDVYFSSASVWEVAIKHSKNATNMPVGGREFVEGCLLAGYLPLPISNQHVLAIEGLKRGNDQPPHNDPFDRILIAQAKSEGMTLITHDGMFAGYGETCVMTV